MSPRHMGKDIHKNVTKCHMGVKVVLNHLKGVKNQYKKVSRVI